MHYDGWNCPICSTQVEITDEGDRCPTCGLIEPLLVEVPVADRFPYTDPKDVLVTTSLPASLAVGEAVSYSYTARNRVPDKRHADAGSA